jgi:hypothetical protein
LQIAKACLAGTDSGVATRTWQNALDALITPLWIRLEQRDFHGKRAVHVKPLKRFVGGAIVRSTGLKPRC